jgi:hypothetical protein
MSMAIKDCPRCRRPVEVPMSFGWYPCPTCDEPVIVSVQPGGPLPPGWTPPPGWTSPTGRGQRIAAVVIGLLIVAASVAALLWWRAS